MGFAVWRKFEQAERARTVVPLGPLLELGISKSACKQGNEDADGGLPRDAV